MTELAPMQMIGRTIDFTYEEIRRLASKRLKRALIIDGEIYVHPCEFEFSYDIDDILITQTLN